MLWRASENATGVLDRGHPRRDGCGGRTGVSSSEIRRLIRQGGRVSLSGRLLERPFTLEGEVVHGYGIGSKQTVPTLNLRTDAQVIPARGVYITRTTDLDGARHWNSITNIGYRPTFGDTCGTDDTLSIETFLLGSFRWRDARSGFAWSFCGAFAMSASSRVPKP